MSDERDWAIVEYGDGDSLVIHDRGTENRICFMATPGSSPNAWPKIQADARLIAAAPKLHDALKDLHEFVEEVVLHGAYINTPALRTRLDKAKAALAKVSP